MNYTLKVKPLNIGFMTILLFISNLTIAQSAGKYIVESSNNYIEWSEGVMNGEVWKMEVNDELVLLDDSTYIQCMRIKMDRGYGIYNSTGLWIVEDNKLILEVKTDSLDSLKEFADKIDKRLVFIIKGEKLPYDWLVN